MFLSVSLLGHCMVELEESCSKKQKISQGNEAAHNSSRTSVLMKLLLIVREFAHKAVHSTQEIVYIRLCLYIIQVHEQFANHCELSRSARKHSQTWWKLFCKVP